MGSKPPPRMQKQESVMAISTSPGYRAGAIGVAAAALLIGAFSLGSSRGGGSTPPAQAATLTSASTAAAGRITVTGTGTVTGVPNQLVLSATIQVNSYSVTSALDEANQVVRAVTAALTSRGVAASDIQTSDLNISPNYSGSSPYPTSYGVSESLTATLNQIGQAGAQIEAAVHAGGNSIQVNDVSLNLTNTGSLIAAARTRAVSDARTQAQQYAKALGEPLGPVVSITPVQQQSPEPEYDFGAANQVAGTARVPISPGTQQLTVTITVVYTI
jgi:uncharacterized protein